jgi:hypothetical protein
MRELDAAMQFAKIPDEYRLARRANKQRDAHLAFKVGELLADGGLRKVQDASGPGKAPLFRYGDEITKMTELHGTRVVGFTDSSPRKEQ